MLTMNGRLLVLAGFLILLTGLVFPAAAAPADSAGCPGCGMVWKDTCAPFEQNNETAYNEETLASFAPVAANLTPVPDFSNRSWSYAFLSMNDLFKERYAYTQWRAVDFDALYHAWAPKIARRREKPGQGRVLPGPPGVPLCDPGRPCRHPAGNR